MSSEQQPSPVGVREAWNVESMDAISRPGSSPGLHPTSINGSTFEMDELRRAGSYRVKRPHSTDPTASKKRTQEARLRSMANAKQKKVFLNFAPPSSRYPEITLPNAAYMKRALTPPAPVLPRRAGKNLSRSQDGPLSRGDLGKKGTIDSREGGSYVGELLAGRPHGEGNYFCPHGDGMRLQYEGNWCQGMREGEGSMYYWTNESYHGDFSQNKRHGYGRMEYRSGDVYHGQFFKDRKQGMGTQYYANGDCFVGFWMNDKREGLGTMYWMSRGKKYEGEWRADTPCTGSMIAMSTEEEAQLAQQRKAAAPVTKEPPQSITEASMPKLKLRTPNKIVFAEAVGVRRERFTAEGTAGKPKRTAQRESGTLDDSTLQRMKHAFVALAGGDGPRDAIRPSKMSDLCVLAGMDPAGTEVPPLLRELNAHTRRNALLYFDDFLDVIINFRSI